MLEKNCGMKLTNGTYNNTEENTDMKTDNLNGVLHICVDFNQVRTSAVELVLRRAGNRVSARRQKHAVLC